MGRESRPQLAEKGSLLLDQNICLLSIIIIIILLYYYYYYYHHHHHHHHHHHKQVDYQVWVIMQERINQTGIHNVDEQKLRLIQLWCDVDQNIIQSIRLLTSDVEDSEHRVRVNVFISSTPCELTHSDRM